MTIRSLITQLERRIADGQSSDGDPVLVRVKYGSAFVDHVWDHRDEGSVQFTYPELVGGLNNLFIDVEDPWSEDPDTA